MLVWVTSLTWRLEQQLVLHELLELHQCGQLVYEQTSVPACCPMLVFLLVSHTRIQELSNEVELEEPSVGLLFITPSLNSLSLECIKRTKRYTW